MNAPIAVQMLRLHDGTLIDPQTKEPIAAQFSSKKDEQKEDVPDELIELADIALHPTVRRSIHDLGLDAKQMAFINNVLVYTLWGLPDDEIAIQCNCTINQVHFVRGLDDYKRMYGGLVEGLQAAYAGSVQGAFHSAAPRAAAQLVASMKSKASDIAFAAARDVLDRAGHRPADRVEHNHTIRGEGELVIRIIKQSDQDAIPSMELNRA